MASDASARVIILYWLCLKEDLDLALSIKKLTTWCYANQRKAKDLKKASNLRIFESMGI